MDWQDECGLGYPPLKMGQRGVSRVLARVSLAGSMVVLLGPSAVAAAPSPSRVIDSDSVGGYRITQSRSRAMDVFGAPTTSDNARRLDRQGIPERDISYCITSWRPLGLIIRYLGGCSLTGRAYRITVEEPGWRTREGLRIGDRASRITQIYRGARTTSGPTAAMYRQWTLMPMGVEWDLRRARPSSGVIVATQSGRVVGFELRRL